MPGIFRKPMAAGFTIMELMVVVAIVLIMTVIAIPNFGTFVANMRLKSATDDLYFSLQQTRINAIRGGGRWMVVFSTSSYQIVNCVDNDCGTTPNTTVKDVPYSKYSSISFTDTFTNHAIIFTSDGMVDNPSNLTPVGTTTISNNKGKSKTITILGTGIIRVS